MPNVFEVVKLNFSTNLARKLLVYKQVKEGSMAEEELFNLTRGMTFDNNNKMSTKMSETVKLVCGMNYNVPAEVSNNYESWTRVMCEDAGYYNLFSQSQNVIWMLSMKSGTKLSGNANVETEYHFRCGSVNDNGVLAQYSLCDEKFGEGCSWIKGYIDDSFKQNLIKEEICEILTGSNPKMFSIGQVYVKVWKLIRLFQVAWPCSSTNLEVISHY